MKHSTHFYKELKRKRESEKFVARNIRVMGESF